MSDIRLDGEKIYDGCHHVGLITRQIMTGEVFFIPAASIGFDYNMLIDIAACIRVAELTIEKLSTSEHLSKDADNE